MSKNNAINNQCLSLTADTFVSAGSQLIAAAGLTVTNGGASIVGNTAISSGLLSGTGGITITGGTISLAADATGTTVNVGTGAGAKVVTVGSTTGASSLALKTGTADFSLASATGTIISAQDTGELTYPLQPAFLAVLSSADNNVTGNGAVYKLGTNVALTEIFDQNGDFNTNGTFTAPVTGKYMFSGVFTLTGTLTTSFSYSYIVTSNNTYIYQFQRGASTANISNQISVLVDMDAADTAYYGVRADGEAGNTDDLQGTTGGLELTYFCGHLEC